MVKTRYKDPSLQKRSFRPRLSGWSACVTLFMAALVVLNFFCAADEPHFYYDQYPGFWPVFGLATGLVIILVMKKIIQPLIKRREDFYGDI